jgi:hypothetical protein
MVTSGSGPAQQVREVVEPVVAAAGLYLEDVEVARGTIELDFRGADDAADVGTDSEEG